MMHIFMKFYLFIRFTSKPISFDIVCLKSETKVLSRKKLLVLAEAN